MAMRGLTKEGQDLLEMVKWVYDFVKTPRAGALSADEAELLRQKNLQIEDVCERHYLSFPYVDTSGMSGSNLRTVYPNNIWFMEIPYLDGRGHIFIASNSAWEHSVDRFKLKIIREFEVKDDSEDMEKVKGKIGIVNFAEKEFHRRPDPRTVDGWIDDGLLRATDVGGGFWSFPKTNLEDLVRSLPPKAEK